MFFATTASPAFRRAAFTPAYAPTSRTVERFLDDAMRATRQRGATFEQDDKSFTLSFDVPGIAKDQLTIGIEANVVRIESKEGAPRTYRLAYELPQDIDASTSEAKLENGVLTVKLARKVVASAVSELAIS